MDANYNKYNVNTIAIIIIFLASIIRDIPFLGKIGLYAYLPIAICLILFMCLVNRPSLKKIYSPFAIFFIYIALIALVTGNIIDLQLWQTLFTFALISVFMATADDDCTYKSLKSINYIIWGICGISLFLYLIGNIFDLYNSNNATIRYTFGSVFSGRLYGVLNSPNTLGILAVVSMVITAFSIEIKSRKNLILNVSMLCINSIVLYLSGCRTALVALIIGALVMVYLKSSHKLRKCFLIILLCALAIFICFHTQILSLMDAITGRSWTTGSGRVQIWMDAIERIKDKPFTGYGLQKNYLALPNTIINPNGTHNLFIEIALRYGIPAFLLFTAFIAYLVIATLRKLSDNSFLNRKTALYISLMAVLIGSFMFENYHLFQCSPMQIILFIVSLKLYYSLRGFSLAKP